MVRHTADGLGHFLHSKEGVTQGYPLAMIAYDIGVLLLIPSLVYEDRKSVVDKASTL